MRIIPAIDIIEGKCVRLSQGDFSIKKIYNENPLEVAKSFEGSGIEYLHLVDLDGARHKHIINFKILELIAAKTNLKIDFGGGLRSDEDLHIAFNSGARQITGGSIAVTNKPLFEGWMDQFGAEKIILGADSKDGYIAINGWKEQSKEGLIPFIKSFQQKKLSYVICTDINKDGMLNGPAFDLYKRIIKNCIRSHTDESLKLIASGGITTLKDLDQLKALGCEGAIIGKALYERRISLKEVERFIIDN